MDEKQKTSVLFICIGNSCRSQMAEGFLRHWAGDRIRVSSAGSHPAGFVSHLTAQVMREMDIDISEHYPKSIDSVKDEKFDWVITLSDFARDFCPVFQSVDGLAKHIHWSIRDPISASDDPELGLQAYRSARDDIARRLVNWLADEYDIRLYYDPK